MISCAPARSPFGSARLPRSMPAGQCLCLGERRPDARVSARDLWGSPLGETWRRRGDRRQGSLLRARNLAEVPWSVLTDVMIRPLVPCDDSAVDRGRRLVGGLNRCSLWPKRSPGPKLVDGQLCLQGILYVLYQDTARQPCPMDHDRVTGSQKTCARRPPSHVSRANECRNCPALGRGTG